MSSKYDLAVLGGGVIGLSIAAQCAKEGWSVCVVERGQMGKESSWAGAGILPCGARNPVEDPIEQLRQLSDRLHEEWAAWLADFTGVDTEYRRSGGLTVARTSAERATMRGNCLWWDELGTEYQRLSSSQVIGLSPAVDPVASDGIAGRRVGRQAPLQFQRLAAPMGRPEIAAHHRHAGGNTN
ncbi:MAG: FAD-dependent oxidoreductase, partial [Planctomycetota bacterium]